MYIRLFLIWHFYVSVITVEILMKDFIVYVEVTLVSRSHVIWQSCVVIKVHIAQNSGHQIFHDDDQQALEAKRNYWASILAICQLLGQNAQHLQFYKKERFIWLTVASEFSPELSDFRTEMTWWKDMAEKNCLTYGAQEAEGKERSWYSLPCDVPNDPPIARS